MATPVLAQANAALDLVEAAQPDLFGENPAARTRRLRELRRVDSYMRQYRNQQPQREQVENMLAMMYHAAQSEFAKGNTERFFEYGSRWLSYMTPQLRTVTVPDAQGGGPVTFAWASGPVNAADPDSV